MIAWRYIDKQNATISALRDYDSMRVIINNTPDEIKVVYERMTAPRSPNLSGIPSARNPKAGEDKLAHQLDKLDVLRERYSNAVEFMAWFEAAWGTLTDNEKFILKEFYMTADQKSGAAARVECELGYCDRQIRRIKEKALERLSVLLFGK